MGDYRAQAQLIRQLQHGIGKAHGIWAARHSHDYGQGRIFARRKVFKCKTHRVLRRANGIVVWQMFWHGVLCNS